MTNKKKQLDSFVTGTCSDGIRIGTNGESTRNGISGDFNDSSLTIPSHFDNSPVVELGINSLSCLSFSVVYVPGTVKRMLRGVFYLCKKLESVHFLTENGKYSLAQFCEGVFHGCTSIKRVVIPPTLSLFYHHIYSMIAKHYLKLFIADLLILLNMLPKISGLKLQI